MDERKSFVFYKSFHDAIKDLPDDIKLECYNAIVHYGLHGEIPQEINVIAKSILTVIAPILDANEKRKENSKKGGAPKGNANARKQPKTTENNQETTKNNQETTENNQETTENNQETTENNQETTKNNQETTENNQETTENNQETTKNNQDEEKNNLSKKLKVKSKNIESKNDNISVCVSDQREKKIFEWFFMKNYKDPLNEAKRFCDFYESKNWTLNGGQVVTTTRQLQALSNIWVPKDTEKRFSDKVMDFVKKLLPIVNERLKELLMDVRMIKYETNSFSFVCKSQDKAQEFLNEFDSYFADSKKRAALKNIIKEEIYFCH